jgi:flagellar M-ring protein FliF
MRALGPARILALFLGVAAVVAMIGMVAEKVSTPGLTLLYGGLSPEEASNISQWLDNQNVQHDVRDDGSIYVPLTKVGELRLRSAGQGLVGSSVTGYEIFDKSSGFGTTSFVQNINARRALEGELARTIASLPAVSSARVHLVIPQRRLFNQDSATPSAAVAINLAGRLLGDGQMENISRLVAAAVPGLTVDNVTIIDQNGNLLFDGKSVGGNAPLMASRVQEKIEKGYEKSLTNMLEKVVGPGKVSVQVTALMNMDRLEEQSEIFDPQRQAVRSEQRSEETLSSNQASQSGAAGAVGNLPGGEAGAGDGNSSNETKSRTEETVNYEITRTIRNLVREGGEILKLSVAVLIEGKYDQEAGGLGEATYKAYTTEELNRFETLVKTAIGFNEERGDTVEIVDMPFSQLPEMEEVTPPMFSKSDIFQLAEYGTLLLGMILVMLLIIRPALAALNKAVETVMPPPPPPPITQQSPTAPLPENGGEVDEKSVSINKVEGRVRESTVKQVNEIIDQHPEESLSVVRGWMADSGSGQASRSSE